MEAGRILPLSSAKMLGSVRESCSREGGEGGRAHNHAGPSLHARACVGSSTRGRCFGTRHDRYTFETRWRGGEKGTRGEIQKGETGRSLRIYQHSELLARL